MRPVLGLGLVSNFGRLFLRDMADLGEGFRCTCTDSRWSLVVSRTLGGGYFLQLLARKWLVVVGRAGIEPATSTL